MTKAESLMNVPFELLILGAAVKAGIIESLRKQELTREELAAELKADARAVRIIAEALVETGYLARKGSTLALAEETKKMLYDPAAPEYTGFAFMHRYNMIKSWLNLPDIISRGRPRPRDFAPEDTAYFMAAMRQGALKSAPDMAEFLLGGSGGGARVLDVGGGPLIYAKAFAGLGAKVTVLDLQRVVDLMGEDAKASGIEMVPEDFNVALPAGPFDLVFLGNICHIFGERENRELYRKSYGVLDSGGRIAIVDFVRGANPFAAVFGVNMLASTVNGDAHTLDQYTEWLEAVGFDGVKLDAAGGRQIITAYKRQLF